VDARSRRFRRDIRILYVYHQYMRCAIDEASEAPSWLSPDHSVEALSWLSSQSGNAPTTSNQEFNDIPFQRWYRFKEAFSPAFVANVLRSLDFRPKTCLDPFGGSGTTALTCQFLGVRPTTIEVNPFLADLIRAKLCRYNPDRLIKHRRAIAEAVKSCKPNGWRVMIQGAPATMVEPGHSDRWIFDAAVAARILSYRCAIEACDDRDSRRLFRVLLGSVLIPLSNVVISGKGRRYRRESRRSTSRPIDVDFLFDSAFQRALFDICRYSGRSCSDYTVFQGDARETVGRASGCDVVLFSPPYPNSFDYTDIYNVELWMLGYLKKAYDNRRLREATLRSHVQIKRDFSASGLESMTLTRTVKRLESKRSELWDPNIPSMVGAYFADLLTVLRACNGALSDQGRLLIVVGDSQYAGISIDVRRIVRELAPSVGLRCIGTRAVRSMRSSAQQGGRLNLRESLLTFCRV
jgi:hypothetical protein